MVSLQSCTKPSILYWTAWWVIVAAGSYCSNRALEKSSYRLFHFVLLKFVFYCSFDKHTHISMIIYRDIAQYPMGPIHIWSSYQFQLEHKWYCFWYIYVGIVKPCCISKYLQLSFSPWFNDTRYDKICNPCLYGSDMFLPFVFQKAF